ncbi:MAG: 23S rRNA (guanosine(2251)-2'-O)-methyltransferase RlmB [Bacteroidota bacterium]
MKQRNPNQNFIYGARAVIEAISAGRSIDKVLLRRELDNELRKEVGQLARNKNIPVQTVPAETIERMAPGSNHQGVVAVTAVIAFLDLEQVLLTLDSRTEPLSLVLLDQVSDVRNFGAIARTAECMGVDAIIIPEEGAARANADAMKVSAGALNHLAVCRVRNVRDAVHLLQAYSVKVIACTEKAADSIFDLDLRAPVCFVLGSEAKGISKSVLKSADHLAAIPMQGKIASLNVSVSAGMVLMETTRQRQIATS